MTDHPPRPARITPSEAYHRCLTQEAALLDVREEAEYAAGHAPGAIWLPLGALEAGAPLPETITGHLVVTICRSGRRSLKAAGLLVARGVETLDVEGGMQAWAEAGLPVRAHAGEDGHVV